MCVFVCVCVRACECVCAHASEAAICSQRPPSLIAILIHLYSDLTGAESEGRRSSMSSESVASYRETKHADPNGTESQRPLDKHRLLKSLFHVGSNGCRHSPCNASLASVSKLPLSL